MLQYYNVAKLQYRGEVYRGEVCREEVWRKMLHLAMLQFREEKRIIFRLSTTNYQLPTINYPLIDPFLF